MGKSEIEKVWHDWWVNYQLKKLRKFLGRGLRRNLSITRKQWEEREIEKANECFGAIPNTSTVERKINEDWAANPLF